MPRPKREHYRCPLAGCTYDVDKDDACSKVNKSMTLKRHMQKCEFLTRVGIPIGEEDVFPLVALVGAEKLKSMLYSPEYCITTYLPRLLWCNADMPQYALIFSSKVGTKLLANGVPANLTAILAVSYNHCKSLFNIMDAEFDSCDPIRITWVEYGRRVLNEKARKKDVKLAPAWPGIRFVPFNDDGKQVINASAMEADLKDEMLQSLWFKECNGRFMTTQEIVKYEGV